MVVFHVVGNGRISGGIDVFLTITGFLITGSLLRRAVAGGGRIRLREHYARLARRLVPPLLVVCVAVAVGGLLILPSTRWLQVTRELVASVLYYENWELISSQLSYDAAGPATSPLQHIWSLSIQGQMHLVWPFLVMAAVGLALRLRRRPERVLGVVLAAAATASFAYAAGATVRDQQVAYFHTGTRLWEIALGGLAALVLPTLHLSRAVRVVLGWVGLGMIVSCGLLIDGAALFPGPAALWPVGGLILILAAGTTGSPRGADRVLGSRGLHVVGDLSYALYLWHWPIVIGYYVLTGEHRIDLGGAAVILAVSFALAWGTHRFVEGRSTTAVVLTALVVVAAVLVIALKVQEVSARDELDGLSGGVTRPGAAAFAAGAVELEPGTRLSAVDVVPSVAAVAEDIPAIYHEGCIQNGKEGTAHSAVRVCEDDVVNPRATVVMTGGSHVVQWWPALEVIAAANDWELVVIDKSGCRLTADRDDARGMAHYESCYQWNELALDEIVARAPDAVFTLGTTTKEYSEVIHPGMVDVWADLGSHGIPVLAIRDTTRFDERVPDCLAREGLAPVECGQARDAVLGADLPVVAGIPDSVSLLDMTPYLCTDEICPAIAGDVIVYRDGSHVSATYMRTLAPYLEEQMRDAAPWLFD